MLSIKNPDSLRILITGLGPMGLRHVEAARLLGGRVVGLHDTRIAAIELGLRRVQTSDVASGLELEEIIERCKPDAMVVASTTDAHFVSMLAGLNARIPYILCEKPFVASVNQARSLRDIASGSSSRIAINHHLPLAARFEVIKGLLDSRILGALVSFDVIAGNVGLAMVASHYVALFRDLQPSARYTVRFWRDEQRETNPRGSQFVDPGGRLMVEAPSGARLFMDLSAESGHGLLSVLVTEYGRIVVDDLQGTIDLSFRKISDQALAKTQYALAGITGKLKTRIEDSVESTHLVWQSLLHGPPNVDLEGALQIVEVLAAAEWSGDHGGLPIQSGDAKTLDRVYPWP